MKLGLFIYGRVGQIGIICQPMFKHMMTYWT